MDVIFNRLARAFFWSLKQWPNVHVKTQIRKCRCNNFCAAVMAILAELGNHYARSTSEIARELRELPFEFFPALG